MTTTLRRTWPGRHEVDVSTGCWNWLGPRVSGYGRCKVGNKHVMAHRAYYEQHVGEIPPGHDLHHHCENRLCVNPSHLEPMTRAKHVQIGPHTKLTKQHADEIRNIISAMCLHYGVKPRTLAAIAEGKIWKED